MLSTDRYRIYATPAIWLEMPENNPCYIGAAIENRSGGAVSYRLLSEQHEAQPAKPAAGSLIKRTP